MDVGALQWFSLAEFQWGHTLSLMFEFLCLQREIFCQKHFNGGIRPPRPALDPPLPKPFLIWMQLESIFSQAGCF